DLRSEQNIRRVHENFEIVVVVDIVSAPRLGFLVASVGLLFVEPSFDFRKLRCREQAREECKNMSIFWWSLPPLRIFHRIAVDDRTPLRIRESSLKHRDEFAPACSNEGAF